MSEAPVYAPESVTFSLQWGEDCHITGCLPADAAHRVIAAVMAPTSVIRFDHNLTPGEADEIRHRFRRNHT